MHAFLFHQFVYSLLILFSLYLTGHHECEILGTGPEAAESETGWKECEKNPGHEEFISAKDFKENYLPRVHTDKHRDRLRTMIDLAVRLRIHRTSPGRPDEDDFHDCRGSDRVRLGTGFISLVFDPVSNEPCPCVSCKGEITRKFWRFRVRTAAHVVYNTEEAKQTKVDLFHDDDSCKLDGRMLSVTGLEVEWYNRDSDVCYIMCVAHDEALGERIKSAWSCWRDEPLDLSGLDLLPFYETLCCPALIVSHPHGQPKKITVGVKRRGASFVGYNTATCRAPVGLQ